MNYNTDRPIENCDQDLLGRSSFSKQLGRAIFEYNSTDGMVIGLYGKWGTGKTSVINMAMNEIVSLSSDKENKPIIMKFAPWNYSDKDNLISIFFQALKNTLELQENEELKKKVGKALSDYAGAFDALSLIPVFGSGVAAVLKTMAKAQGVNLMQEADLNKTRERLEQALLEENRKIIIVIDDIDRLTNSQIRDIFQLVKQVADFPNVIYVLAMEREVVRSALKEVHNIDGNEYLEKIIQIPIEIPELRRSKLHDIFFAKLNQIIHELPAEIVWDQQYWNNVFQNCVGPYLNTLRDVNRVINTFRFKYATLYQETSFEDMVGITTIEVLEPVLYKWISNNKESVCGGFLHSLMSVGNKKNDFRKQYSEEFLKLGIDSEKSIKCISAMFPVFAKDVNEYSLGFQSSSVIREKMRAAHKERFELYFMFDLDDIKVPRSIINACIFILDFKAIQSIIEEVNKEGKTVYFLEEVSALIEKIPYERLDLLASVIINQHGTLEGESERAIFSVTARSLAEKCIWDIILKLNNEDERNNVLCEATNHANKNGLGAIARIIQRIEFGYGRLSAGSEKEEDQIISLNQLDKLAQLFSSEIQMLSASESLLELSECGYILSLWELIDKEKAQQYITSLIKDDFKKLKYVCAMAGRWSGSNGNGWSYRSKEYSAYTSDEEVYDLIQKLDKNRLDEFSEIEQIKLATFVLNYKKDESCHANEQEARKLVEKWKRR